MVEAHAITAQAQSTLDYIERHKDDPVKLAMSGMARCVRQTYLATFVHQDRHPLQRGITHSFSTYLLVKFEHGKMYEWQLKKEIAHSLADHEFAHEPRLGDNTWSGRPDFVIGPSGQFPEGMVLDCKATDKYVFAYTMGRIPRLSDSLQVLVYQHYLRKERPEYGWPARLYYRGWGQYGEFQIVDDYSCIRYEGTINGNEVGGEFGTTLADEMARVDEWWEASSAPSVEPEDIPGYLSPFDSTFGCLRKKGKKGYSACRWLSECWPQFEPGNEGPFEWPEEEEYEEVF